MDSWIELTGSVDYRTLSDSQLLGLTNGSIDLHGFLNEYGGEHSMALLKHLETLTYHYSYSTTAKRAYIIRLKTRKIVRRS